jgi:hypothetical protein
MAVAKWRMTMSRAGDPMKGGFEVLEDFERFSQVDDVFSRSWWDPSIRSDKSERFLPCPP